MKRRVHRLALGVRAQRSRSAGVLSVDHRWDQEDVGGSRCCLGAITIRLPRPALRAALVRPH